MNIEGVTTSVDLVDKCGSNKVNNESETPSLMDTYLLDDNDNDSDDTGGNGNTNNHLSITESSNILGQEIVNQDTHNTLSDSARSHFPETRNVCPPGE